MGSKHFKQAGDAQGICLSAKQMIGSGNLSEAENLLLRSLKHHRENTEILSLLSFTLCRLGKLQEAGKYARKAISHEPKNPMLHCNLALVLTQNGLKEDAIRCYQTAVRLSPGLPEAHYNMGILYRELKQADKAKKEFSKAIELKPDFVHAHNSLGNIERDQEHLDAAVTSYKTALGLDPNSFTSRTNLAAVLYQTGDTETSLSHYEKAIKSAPQNAEGHLGIANVYLGIDQTAPAINHYRSALRLKPDSIDALFGLGNAYYHSDEFDKAVNYYEELLGLNPAHSKVLTNLATSLHQLGRYEDAADLYKKALKISRDSADTLYNLGNTLIELGLIDDAIDNFKRALDLCPENEEIHWDLSRALLLSANFEQGWIEYEWRLKRKTKLLRRFPQTKWAGEPLKEKTILVHAEQGIGDEIAFASCIPDLSNEAKTVILDCEPRLAPLFKRSFPDAIIHGGRQDEDVSWAEQYPDADYQLPIASLPGFYRPGLKSFPRRNSFLVPDTDMCAHWKKELSLLPHTCSVGISWTGGGTPKTKSVRHIPLDLWESMLSLKGVNFIDLQYGEHQHELETFTEKSGIVIHSFESIDPLVNMDEFAALIAALDLVISVDNSTVHISASLGIPTYVLLPFSPDWRWLISGNTTPWYSSVRLFRQPEPGSWLPAITELESELSGIPGTYGNGSNKNKVTTDE